MLALIYTDQQRAVWVVMLKYGLFFAGAVVNLTLCYGATRVKQTRPFLTAFFFAAPLLLATAPTVPFMWYGGSAIVDLSEAGANALLRPGSLWVFLRSYLPNRRFGYT